MTITYRLTKGTPLTFTELDGNFVDLLARYVALDNLVAATIAEKGQPDGYATLDAGGKVPASQLPTYASQVLEYASFPSFPPSGEASKLYITQDTHKSFHWTGVEYAELSVSHTLTDVAYKSIFNPAGGILTTATPTSTGAIKIVLPAVSASSFSVTIKVTEASGDSSFDVHCGGYFDGISAWTGAFAYVVGAPDSDLQFTVRLGFDGSKPIIYIGELTTVWSTPQVFVTECLVGKAGQSVAYTSGWFVNFEATTFFGVTYTRLNPQVGYATPDNVPWAAAQRDAFGDFTARTITASLADTNGYRTLIPAGGYYYGAVPATGAIAVSFPAFIAQEVSATIKVHEEISGNFFEVHCGGSYDGTTWTATFAYILGKPTSNRQFTVRFGGTGTGIIYIGELASAWDATLSVFVTEFLSTDGSLAAANGWTIGIESTAFNNVTATESTPQLGAIVARTLWGQSFDGTANVSGDLTYVGNITGTAGITLTATGAALNLATTGANPIIASPNGLEKFRVGGAAAEGVGIGSTTLTARGLVIGNPLTGSTTGASVYAQNTVQSDVTASAYGLVSGLATQATAFTLANLYHVAAIQGAIGAGSSITAQVGFFAESTLTGAANNYGFRGQIPAGAGRWNLYMDGTAANYLAGDLTIGGTITASGGTANGVAYLNASKVLTTGTALTFDGTRALSVGTGAATLRAGVTVDGGANAGVGAGFFINVAGVMAGALASSGYAAADTSTDLAVYAPTGKGVRIYANGAEAVRVASSGGGVGIGSTALTARGLVVGNALTGATTGVGVMVSSTIASDVTGDAYGFYSRPTTAAAAFTLAGLSHFVALQPTLGAGSAITTQTGFLVDPTLVGATNNYGFRGRIPSGANRWNLYMDGTAANYLAGPLGIGSTSLTARGLVVGNTLTGSTTGVSVYAVNTFQSDVTTNGYGFLTDLSTAAAVYTLSNLPHYTARQATIGAGSTVTIQTGFLATSSLIGATNNYGFRGQIAAGTGRYNLYMDGTAVNYMAGNLGIGIVPNAVGTIALKATPAGLSAITVEPSVGADAIRRLNTTGSGANIGFLFSSGAPYLGYQARANGAALGFVASSSATTAPAAVVADNGFVSLYAGPTQTNSDGSAVNMPERLRVDGTSGAIGIGTSTPATLLDVSHTTDGAAIRISSAQNDSVHSTSVPYGSFEVYSVDASAPAAGVKGALRVYPVDPTGFGGAALAFTVASASSNDVERMRIDSYGAVGIGVSSGLLAKGLVVGNTLTGNANAVGVSSVNVIASDVVTTAHVFLSAPTTQAAAFTLSTLGHFTVAPGSFGAGSAVTTQVGFNATAGLTGATNNYGFRGSIAAGTGRYNLYMDGTAVNYLAGSLGVGVSSPLTTLDVRSVSGITSSRDQQVVGASLQLGIINFASRYDASVYATGVAIQAFSDGAWTSTSWPSYLSFKTIPAGSAVLTEAVRIGSNGAVGIGVTSLTARGLVVGNLLTGNGTAISSYAVNLVASDVTASAYGFRSSLNTQAAAFNLNSLIHFGVTVSALGAGSSVTSQHGFFVDQTLTAGTNNYGFRGSIPVGTGRYNLYMDGTADNHLAGRLLIGSATSVSTGSFGAGALQIASDVYAAQQIWSHNASAANFSALQFGKSRGTRAAPTIVASGDYLGEVDFVGYDGAAYQRGAAIIAQVEAAPAAGSMPTSLLFSTTPSGSSAPVERMRLNSAGDLLVGGTSTTTPQTLTRGVYLQSTGASDVVGYSLYTNDGVKSPRVSVFLDNANSLFGFASTFSTIAPSFVIKVGANTEKFRIGGSSSEGVGIGTTALSARGLAVGNTLTGATAAFGVYSASTIASDVTGSTHAFRSQPNTQAAAFTLAALYHFSAVQGSIGAGSAISAQTGFIADASLIGATNNYGFRGAIPAGAGRWNLYMDGTAINYLEGNLGVGTTTPNVGSFSKAISINRSSGSSSGLEFLLTGAVEGSVFTRSDGNAGLNISTVSTRPIVFNPNGTEAMRVAGDGKVAIGSVGDATYGKGATADLSVAKATAWTTISARSYANSAPSGGLLVLGKSRSATVGTLVETQTADTLGYIIAEGVNASSANRWAAAIAFEQDGAAGITYIPGRIVFRTGTSTADVTTRATINSGGNFGLGITPSDWDAAGAGAPILQIGRSAFWGNSDRASTFYNAYYNAGVFKYIGAGYATAYEQTLGVHKWFVAASGVANATITFTQAMTLDATGNLGIGTTSNASFTLGVATTAKIAGTNPYLAFGPDFTASTPGFIQYNTATDDLDVYGLYGVSIKTAAGLSMRFEANGSTYIAPGRNLYWPDAYKFFSPARTGGSVDYYSADLVTNSTGAIAVELPSLAPSEAGIRLTLKIFTAVTGESFDLVVGGSISTTGTWTTVFAYTLGNPLSNRMFNVRFGSDTGSPIVYIGELATVWTGLNVYVLDVEYTVGGSAIQLDWPAIRMEPTAFWTVGATITTSQVGLGFKPINSQSAAYTTVMADALRTILHPSADTTARTFTIDSNANVPYPPGTELNFVNQNGAGTLTISITTDTMRLAGAGTTGNRTLAANGVATAKKLTATEWIISGVGLT